MTTTIGVVGYGYWGSKHVRVLSTLADVEVHVIDADPVRRKHAQIAFPSATIHSDLGDAVDRLDGLVVATPAASHHGLAKFALERGVHCLVEKPLAVNSVDCLDLIETADGAGAKLMVGHTFEFNSGVRMVRDLMDSGELGTIHYVDTARLNLGLYQPDVNVIWDLGPHDISILNFLLRSLPTSVSASAHCHRSNRMADVANLHMRYDDLDVTASTRLSWLDPVKVRRVSVVGSRKMVVNNDTASERIRVYDAGVDPQGPPDRFQDRPIEYRYGDIVSPHVPFEEPLMLENRHFVECIRDDKEPEPNGWSGLAVVQVLEAAERSILERRTVEVHDRDLVASGSS